jgi:hypothetical protein
MKDNLNKAFCINLKGHDEKQLYAISEVYNIGFEFLKDLKTKYERIWVVKETESDGVYNNVIATMCRDKSGSIYYRYPNSNYDIKDIKKVVQSVKPIKVPKLPTHLKSKIYPKEVRNLDLDSILDKISISGMESLTQKELKFLEKASNNM